MLTYNTNLKKLILPEYGRNIQNMVDHCMTIPDRDERTFCAHTIVDTMQTLFPAQGDPQEYRRKLWDHLAIMSDFALDIDWPFAPVRPDSLEEKPDPIPLPQMGIRYRHYGKTLVGMIESAGQMPEGEERDALILLLANHAKKMLIGISAEGVEDERVFKDMRDISHGAIRLDPTTTKLFEFKALPAPSSKKKKKK